LERVCRFIEADMSVLSQTQDAQIYLSFFFDELLNPCAFGFGIFGVGKKTCVPIVGYFEGMEQLFLQIAFAGTWMIRRKSSPFIQF